MLNIFKTARSSFLLALLVVLYDYCNGVSESSTRKSSFYNQPFARFGRLHNDLMNNLIKRKHFTMGKGSRENNATLLELKAYPQVATHWISQRIDHFSQTDQRKYDQRFMYNMEFYNDSGLAFLLVGGEGEIVQQWLGIPSSPVLIWAKKYGAVCFLLEHRFFGKSQPFKDVSVENFQYLSVNQALADLKNFIEIMTKTFFWDVKKPRFVLFGESYSGALAAWFRATNEDLTTAAIVSSGVVQARVNHYDYYKNVEDILKEESSKCAEAIQLGMEEIMSKIYTLNGRLELAEVFDICDPFPEPPTHSVVQHFFGSILFVFGQSVQYSKQRSLSGILEICSAMVNGSEESYMKRIRDAWNIFEEKKESECRDLNYETYLKNRDDLNWFWLSCTEFGFFPTTDNGKSIFGSSLPLSLYINECMSAFGGQNDAEYVRNGVHKTLLKYGGNDNYNGTRTVFVNGSNDPWKSLCCLNCNDTVREVYSVLIEGSHAMDTVPIDLNDSESLRYARAFVDNKLEMFIKQSF
uniref:Uncharacterized protein n=1 Tax=Setaria digitata TaxID=48799 RepID=A0A915PJ41_9BILA